MYVTPNGMADEPYWFVQNGWSYANGSSHSNITIPTAADYDFILRRVTGSNTMCNPASVNSKMQVKGPGGAYITSKPIIVGNSGINFFSAADYLVLPELEYPRLGGIQFDIYNASGYDYSQVGFCGVRRKVGSYPSGSAQRYRLQYWRQSITDTQDWTFNGGVWTYNLNVDNYDFEVYSLNVVDSSFSAGTGPSFKVLMRNFAGNALSNAPVIGVYLNNRQQPNANNYMTGAFNPPLFYPKDGQITWDICALIDNGVANVVPNPTTMDISFVGMRRIPV